MHYSSIQIHTVHTYITNMHTYIHNNTCMHAYILDLLERNDVIRNRFIRPALVSATIKWWYLLLRVCRTYIQYIHTYTYEVVVFIFFFKYYIYMYEQLTNNNISLHLCIQRSCAFRLKDKEDVDSNYPFLEPPRPLLRPGPPRPCWPWPRGRERGGGGG